MGSGWKRKCWSRWEGNMVSKVKFIRRQCFAVLVCCLMAMLLGACSFTNHFVVYNRTDHDLLLRYKLNSSSRSGYFYTRVVVHETKQDNYATDTCTFNSQTGIIEIRLRKAHHITIGGGFCTTYQSIKNIKSVFETELEGFNNLQYLEIVSDKGQLRCQGDLLETLITKNRLTLTRIDIKQL